MKKQFVCSCLFSLVTCLFTACGSDDDDSKSGKSYDDVVEIYDNGSTSNGTHYTPINDKSFYLDYVLYTIVDAHLEVAGHDKIASNGIVNIVSSIKLKGARYDVLRVRGRAFENCTDIRTLAIPKSVTEIGKSAFQGCSGLTSIKVDAENRVYDSRENCNAIIITESNHLVAGCNNTTVPNGVKGIGYGAFYNCHGLTTITIPNSVEVIGDQAFYGCSNLTSVYISDLEAWCKMRIYYSPLTYATHLFLNGEEIKDLVIPNSVTSIGENAFSGYSGLTSVIIPNSVTDIGRYAFQNCSGLTSITIPNGVTNIDYKAFHNCSGLTSITLPNSVTSIKEEAFGDCKSIKDVYCYIEVPISISESVFNVKWDKDNSITLHVPAASIDAYKSTSPWRYFHSIVAM